MSLARVVSASGSVPASEPSDEASRNRMPAARARTRPSGSAEEPWLGNDPRGAHRAHRALRDGPPGRVGQPFGDRVRCPECLGPGERAQGRRPDLRVVVADSIDQRRNRGGRIEVAELGGHATHSNVGVRHPRDRDRRGGEVGAGEPEGLAPARRPAEHVRPPFPKGDEQLLRVGPPDPGHRIHGPRRGHEPDAVQDAWRHRAFADQRDDPGEHGADLVGPPYRKARIRSRRSPGTVLITASHALDAPPWSHTTWAKRKARGSRTSRRP